MPGIKFEFENKAGQNLSGLLEVPGDNISIASYAVFAHCFTCGKDIAAASRISRSLAARGIAVLRFDFTGLGNSDGDFANTNFSSNVEDLIAAANSLGREFKTPDILIGHSLGGSAVLAAAHQLASVKAIVTIGAPATASHVEHLFASDRSEIVENGEADVNLGGRKFTIKEQFISDIETYNSVDQIGQINKALLIFHSPIDKIVSVDQAAGIYQAARHPKSFISLDQADHLLSKAADAEYVGATIAAWAGRYLELPVAGADQKLKKAIDLSDGEVFVSELNKKFLRGLYTTGHDWLADEPEKYGGNNLGPTPYDLLLLSLGACTSMTLRMYANRKKLELDDVEVKLIHERVHAEDCEGCNDKIERITRKIKLVGNLTEQERQRLLEIADRCPVHRTMESDPVIVSELES